MNMQPSERIPIRLFEEAEFVLNEIENGRYIREMPFIGHGR